MEQQGKKIITVNSSILIVFDCPYCSNRLEVQSAVPPSDDFTYTCPKCGQESFVNLNKRAFYRKKVNIPVAYSMYDIVSSFDRRAKKGRLIDISTGGLCIENDISIFSEFWEKEGNILFLLFTLPPREKELKVKGKIHRIRFTQNGTYHLPIEFLFLTEHQNSEIRFFLW